MNSDWQFNVPFFNAGTYATMPAYYNQNQALPGLTLPPGLQQDGFYKNQEVMLYEKGNVSSMQAELNKKQRELKFNQKMLQDYPDDPRYGRKVDELTKEIEELEKEIVAASKS